MSTDRNRTLRAAAAVPLLLAGAFLALLLATFGDVVAGMYTDSDAVSLPLIGQLYPSAPNHADVVVGFGGWFTGLWAELLTSWVPYHWQLWEVGPWFASLAAIALVVWSTIRAAGRTAGLLVAFLLTCAGPILLSLQFEWAKHGASAAIVCVLGAYLVLLVRRDGLVGGRVRHLALGAVVAALTASGAASDELLFVSGVAPFVLTGLVLAFLLPRDTGRRLAVATVGVGVVAVAASRVVVWAMRTQHVHPVYLPIKFAMWDRIVPNVVGLAESLADLFNGDFGGSPLGPRALLTLGCAVVVAAGVVVAAREARSWTSQAFHRIERGEREGSDSFGTRAALLTFWLLSATFTAAAFVLTSVAQDHGGRYLLPLAYGLTVVVAVGVAERPWRRWVAFAAACVVVTGSVVSLSARDLRPKEVDRHFASLLLAYAQSQGLTYGYAQYWDAGKLAGLLQGKLKIYRVDACNAPHGVCKFPFNTISSWYQPNPNTHSFLIADPRYGIDPGNRLGGTEAAVSLGPYTLDVFDYDIASDFGPAPPWLGTYGSLATLLVEPA
jgi:hypothetical protein